MKLAKHLALAVMVLLLPLSNTLHANSHLTLKEQTLLEVLDQLGEKYQVFFSYDSELLSSIKVNFELRDYEQLETAVNRALKDTGLKYKNLDGKYYVVYKDNKLERRTVKKITRKFKQIEKLEKNSNVSVQRSSTDKQAHLLSVFQSAEALTAFVVVTGNVTDTEGTPLIGASVLVKGTTIGTVTDAEGNFSINVPDGENVLVISYTGYATTEIDIAG
ncbi:MAG: carboxypeptidase-like regulatory domain-containing protein [Bacteroidota bacterium]